MTKAQSTSVILLSSGLDSTINLYAARERSRVVLALTFDYGQRAAPREVERAALIAKHAGVAHRVIHLPWFSEFTRTALVNVDAAIPVQNEISIDDQTVSERSAKAVWVPNRNGIFLNVAAAFAEGLGADWLVPGFNIEEAATFPDNTEDFLRATTSALAYSTANHVQAKCFTTALNKTEIVRLGRRLCVPFEFIWPCYLAGAQPCGECESCQRFKRAMTSA